MVGFNPDLPPRFRDLSVSLLLEWMFQQILLMATYKALINYLNMIENPVIKKKVYRNYLTDIIVNQQDTIKELEGDEHYAMADKIKQKNLLDLKNIYRSLIGK